MRIEKLVREKLNDYMQIGNLIKMQTISTILGPNCRCCSPALWHSNILFVFSIYMLFCFVWYVFFGVQCILLLCVVSLARHLVIQIKCGSSIHFWRVFMH